MVVVGDRVLVAPLNGQKDNPVVVGAGGGVSEGNYNTWTLEWYKILRDPVLTSDLPDGLHSIDRFGFFIDDRNNTIHISWEDGNGKYRYGIFSCTDFTNLTVSPGTWSVYDPAGTGTPSVKESYFLGVVEGCYGFSRSIQTYVLFLAYDPAPYYNTANLNVHRNASLLWNHSVLGDLPSPQSIKADVEWAAISTTGKYIVAITQCYDSGYYENIMLYKGSYVE